MTRQPTLARFCARIFPALAIIILVQATSLEAQDRAPMTEEQIVRLVRSGVFADARIVTLAEEACLAFRVDADSEGRLRASGASESLVRQLRGVCVKIALPVNVVVVTPQQSQIDVGADTTLRAQALSDSVVVPDIEFRWSSQDTMVARVRDGVVVGVGPGTTRVFARADADGEVAGFASVMVTGMAAGGERSGGKSVGTAAALGTIFPGGGEYYTGSTAKGVAVTLGVAGALAAGYLITSTDTLTSQSTITGQPTCSGSSCTFPVSVPVETSRNVLVGAIAAGAIWAYGLVDGIRSAKAQSAPSSEEMMDGELARVTASPRIEILPAGGVDVRVAGVVDFTLVRIKT